MLNWFIGTLVTIIGHTLAFCIKNPPVFKLVVFILIMWFLWSCWLDFI